MKENVLERMERIGAEQKMADFMVKQQMPYSIGTAMVAAIIWRKMPFPIFVSPPAIVPAEKEDV